MNLPSFPSLTIAVTNLIEANGLLAIFVLMFFESFFIPFPSEITMAFGGFLAGRDLFDFWQVVAVGATGNVLGSILSYLVGYAKGEKFIRKILRSFGKLVFLKESDFLKAKKWFDKYDQTVLLPARMLPVVRAFISLPAGITRMNFALFLVLTTAGSFVWTVFLTFLGLKLGQNWLFIVPYFRQFQVGIATLVLVGVIYYVRLHFKKA